MDYIFTCQYMYINWREIINLDVFAIYYCIFSSPPIRACVMFWRLNNDSSATASLVTAGKARTCLSRAKFQTQRPMFPCNS